MTDPIQKTLHIPLRPKTAFDLFTNNLDKWWPTESHSLSAGEGETPNSVTVERHTGGHIVEEKHNGEVAKWGTITKWDDGRSLSVSWYVGRDQEEATDLEVVFIPTDMGTRVQLTHSGFDRLGKDAVAMLENYTKGWDLVLTERFGTYCLRQKVTMSQA